MTLNLSFGNLQHPLTTYRGGEVGIGLSGLINTGIAAVTYISGIAVLAYLVYGGFRYATAGGDKDKVEEARDTISNGLIGLVIVVAAILVTQLIGQILGFENILDPMFLGPGEVAPEAAL